MCMHTCHEIVSCNCANGRMPKLENARSDKDEQGTVARRIKCERLST